MLLILLVKDYYTVLVQIIIDALCANLSDAIRNGLQENAVELVKQFARQKLPLSIKLKNPVLVTMDSGEDTIK